jgi:hypothetical protein
MMFEYVIRGQTVSIERIDDLFAVFLDRQRLRRPERSTSVVDIARPPSDDIVREDWEAFNAGGWFFVRANDSLARAWRMRSMPAGITALQQVFLDADGRVILGGDRLCVRLTDDVAHADAMAHFRASGLTIVNQMNFARNLFEVRVPPGQDFLRVALLLSTQAAIKFAEPDFIAHLPCREKPTDPYFEKQWQWKNINAEEAWKTTCGAGIRVAVIDNGFQVDHPDLVGAWANTSGYYKEDWGNKAIFCQDINGIPDEHHGTFCASLAGARANNNEGGCGVAYGAELVAIACLRDQLARQCTLARAVAYAADPGTELPGIPASQGAHVISCSLGSRGGKSFSMTSTLQEAIDFAVTDGRNALGVPIVWAVSNGRWDNIADDEVCSYERTIAVRSSDKSDKTVAGASGKALDMLAPGEGVYSATTGSAYGDGSGTSYAAAIVAGVAALVVAVDSNLPWQEIRCLLRRTCEKTGTVNYDGSGHHYGYGWGVVNAGKAVSEATHT